MPVLLPVLEEPVIVPVIVSSGAKNSSKVDNGGGASLGGVSGAGGIPLNAQAGAVVEAVPVEVALVLDWNVVGLVLEGSVVLASVDRGRDV